MSPPCSRPLPSCAKRVGRKGCECSVPSVCILDPDGDIVRRLLDERRAQLLENWPCYHTDLHTFPIGSETVGIFGTSCGCALRRVGGRGVVCVRLSVADQHHLPRNSIWMDPAALLISTM